MVNLSIIIGCIDLHYQRSSDLGALSDIVNESFLNAIFRAEKKHFKHTIHLFKEVREFPGEQQDRISSRCVSFQMEVGVSLLQGVPVYVGQSVKFEYQIIVALNNNVIENSDALNTITPSAESITHCDVQSLHVEFSETTDWIPFKRKIVINHIPNGALCSKSPLSIPVVAEMISFSSGKCLLPPLNVRSFD